jgi:hypothetical protein
MSKQFTYTIQGDVETKLKQVRTEVTGRGIEFQGDTKEGKFSGHISGSYIIEGQRITVTVESKPLLVPWGNVDSRLKTLLKAKENDMECSKKHSWFETSCLRFKLKAGTSGHPSFCEIVIDLHRFWDALVKARAYYRLRLVCLQVLW